MLVSGSLKTATQSYQFQPVSLLRSRGLVGMALDLQPVDHWMDLFLVVPDSTLPRFVNGQLVSLQPVWISNKFLFNLQYLFVHFGVLKYYSSATHFGN